MIIGNIKDCERYYAVNEKFIKAFEFLKNMSADVALGRHDIDGDNVYASVMSYDTKDEKDCVIEAHRKYIDVQCMISGTEIMEINDISTLKSSVPYDEKIDAEFFVKGEPGERIIMSPGKFAIFFPEDLHKGAIMKGDVPDTVKKVVVKVKI